MSARRQRQVFSIISNRDSSASGEADAGDIASQRHRQLMTAISRISGGGGGGGVAHDAPTAEEAEAAKKELAEYRATMEQMQRLRSELEQIQGSIAETKKEIAGLHQSGLSGENMSAVTHELDEVVSGTETATESILTASEEIDRNAGDLAASLRQSRNQEQAAEIQEHVVQIFEACNFQDLTGQRITKVVNTLKYVEERVNAMMDIWGGLEAFDAIKAKPMPNPAGHDDDDLLHGPGNVDEDPSRASQGDIDALFD